MQQNSMKNCILTLEKLRDAYNSQLDTSTLVELNAVIDDLKMADDHTESKATRSNSSLRAIQVIADVISLVSNIKDLMM